MNFIKNIFTRIKKLGRTQKIILAIIVAVIVFFIYRSLTASQNTTQYQTAQPTSGIGY